MELIVILLLLFFFSEVLVPLIRDAVVGLMTLLVTCVVAVLGLAFRVPCWLLIYTVRGAIWILIRLCRVLAWTSVQGGRGAWLGLMFTFYVVDEWWRGPRDEEPEADEFFSGEAADDAEPEADTYEQALARLGLAPGFTQAALRRAYRDAIRAAHPDNPDGNGSTEAAQAVNSAYEFVLRTHGWAR